MDCPDDDNECDANDLSLNGAANDLDAATLRVFPPAIESDCTADPTLTAMLRPPLSTDAGPVADKVAGPPTRKRLVATTLAAASFNLRDWLDDLLLVEDGCIFGQRRQRLHEVKGCVKDFPFTRFRF